MCLVVRMFVQLCVCVFVVLIDWLCWCLCACVCMVACLCVVVWLIAFYIVCAFVFFVNICMRCVCVGSLLSAFV